MSKKKPFLCMLCLGLFAGGALAGYLLRCPNSQLMGGSDHVSVSTLDRDHLQSLLNLKLLPEADRAIEAVASMKLVVTVGDCHLLVNPTNRDFALIEKGCDTPSVVSTTHGGVTTQRFLSKNGCVTLDVVYDHEKQRVAKATVCSFDQHGPMGDLKQVYIDTTGDGVFNMWLVPQSGCAYRLVDGQWQRDERGTHRGTGHGQATATKSGDDG